MEHSASRAFLHYQSEQRNLKLISAAERGAIRKVKRLVQEGADVNFADARGRRALHVAASNGFCDIALFLIDAGAQVDAVTTEGETPLFHAVENSKVDMADLLLTYGSNVDHSLEYGTTPLMMSAGLGDTAMTQKLLDFGAALDAVDVNRCTALFMAVRSGSPDVVNLLLSRAREEHLDMVSSLNADGVNALHLAAQEGRADIVMILLLNAAALEVTTLDHGLTALLLACEQGALEVVQLLLESGAQTHRRNRLGQTALHLAVDLDANDMALCLLQHGIDVDAKDGQGCTPLHGAVSRSNREMVKLLLDWQADPRKRDQHNRLPLHLALSTHPDSCKMIELLVLHGADLSATNATHMTALQLACALKLYPCAQTLVNLGAPLTDATLNGKTALHFAAEGDCVEIASLLLDRSPGCDLITTAKGKTPLAVAIKKGSVGVIHLLLAKGLPCAPPLLKLLLQPPCLDRLRARHPADGSLRPLELFDLLAHSASHEALDVATSRLQAAVLERVRSWLTGEDYSDDDVLGMVTDCLPLVPKNQIPALLHGLASCNLDIDIRLKTLRPMDVAQANDLHSPLAGALAQLGLLDGYLQAQSHLKTLASWAPPHTPLLLALFNDDLTLGELMLQAGASVQLPCVSGDSPLHLAVAKNDIRWVTLLLRYGARTDMPNLEDQTPVDLAQHLGLREIEALLREPR